MNKKKFFAVIAAISVLASVAYSQSFKYRETAPGVQMRYIGPGNGGSMFGMAFHPSNPDIMLFGGDMGACFRTENGGKTWDILPGDSADCPRATWNVRFHPKDNNIVWHLGSGVLKSIDAGKTWKNSKAPNGTYCALGLDPDNTEIAYVSEGLAPRMILNWTTGKVLKTVNGGKTWRRLTPPKGALKHPNFTNFIIDPDSKVTPGEGHATVYLFGRGGLFRSDDAGKIWKDLSGAFAPGQINDMVMTKNSGKTTLLLAVAPAQGLKKGGVYKSSDNGETWTAVNNGLETLIANLKKRHKLKAKPESSIYAILLAHSKAAPSRIYAGSRAGIYRSDNGGKSWYELAHAEGCAYVKDENGAYMAVPKQGSNFETSIWGGIDNFNRFIVDQNNADRVAFSDNEDMYISTNGGKMWDSLSFDFGELFAPDLYPEVRRPNRFTNKVISRGPQNLVCDTIVIDPFNPKIYYAAFMDVGLQISRDGGKSWEHPTKGTPGRGHAWSVVPDPGKKGRVFLTIGQDWGQKGGIYRSDDSGISWQRIGMDNAKMGRLQSVVIDLKSPVNKRVIYIGSQKRGIYQSSDGGNNWKNITSTFKGAANNVLHIAIAPGSSKIIYAGTGAGLFISKDAGKSWKQLGKGSFEKIESIAICKIQPSTLYICAHYPGKNGSWGESALWRSTNRGNTFTKITPAYFKYSGAIAVNPFNPDYIYACNSLINITKPEQKMKIIRSKNGGKSWEIISANLACNRAKHLIIDQQDPRKLFILTRFGIIECRDNNAPVKSAMKR